MIGESSWFTWCWWIVTSLVLDCRDIKSDCFPFDEIVTMVTEGPCVTAGDRMTKTSCVVEPVVEGCP